MGIVFKLLFEKLVPSIGIFRVTLELSLETLPNIQILLWFIPNPVIPSDSFLVGNSHCDKSLKQCSCCENYLKQTDGCEKYSK